MRTNVSLIVDIRHARCGACKMAIQNELATSCPSCGSVFESIQSNHAGLALKFERRRAAAGVFEPKAVVPVDEPEADNEFVSHRPRSQPTAKPTLQATPGVAAS